MFLLQILDKTHGLTEDAKVAGHERLVRVEVEDVRVAVTVFCGRLIVAVGLQKVHFGTEAAARSREEDRTCGFEF